MEARSCYNDAPPTSYAFRRNGQVNVTIGLRVCWYN
jgi:hypothetical protein